MFLLNKEFLNESLDEVVWARLSARFNYLQLDISNLDEFKKLGAVLDQNNRITVSYLAIPAF